jgi:hypothetical protein
MALQCLVSQRFSRDVWQMHGLANAALPELSHACCLMNVTLSLSFCSIFAVSASLPHHSEVHRVSCWATGSYLAHNLGK